MLVTQLLLMGQTSFFFAILAIPNLSKILPHFINMVELLFKKIKIYCNQRMRYTRKYSSYCAFEAQKVLLCFWSAVGFTALLKCNKANFHLGPENSFSRQRFKFFFLKKKPWKAKSPSNCVVSFVNLLFVGPKKYMIEAH